MHPNWLPSNNELHAMAQGSRYGIWVCWAYMNATGDKVIAWNRDGTYPPLDHKYPPVGFVVIKMDNE